MDTVYIMTPIHECSECPHVDYCADSDGPLNIMCSKCGREIESKWRNIEYIPDWCPLRRFNDIAQCDSCKHFIRFATSETEGFCMVNNLSMVDSFKGCKDWVKRK